MSSNTPTTEHAPTQQGMVVYVQLRPQHIKSAAARERLSALAAAHPETDVRVIGHARSDRYNHITLAVNVGDTTSIKTRAKQSVAALLFVNELMKQMADSNPVYVDAPTADEQASARTIFGDAQQSPTSTPAATTAATAPQQMLLISA